MLKAIAIFGLLGSLALVDASRRRTEVGPAEESSRFPRVDRKYISANGPFSFKTETKTGQDPMLDQLCQNNIPGNYQYPYKCNASKFIQCGDGGQVFLADCPAGLIYNPIPDMCVYNNPDGADFCPWKSIWENPDTLSCATLGQHPWWSLLTFPTNPRECCGRGIYFCNKYQQIGGVILCPPGFGYSKACLGCLEYRTCKIVDNDFGLG